MRADRLPALRRAGRLADLARSWKRSCNAATRRSPSRPGSAMWQGAEILRRLASTPASRSNRRGLLLTRHRDHLPPTLPPGVIHVHYAPFSKLLPRCAAFVHHARHRLDRAGAGGRRAAARDAVHARSAGQFRARREARLRPASSSRRNTPATRGRGAGRVDREPAHRRRLPAA